ncbi:MAG: virulence protein SciE type [Gemmatimonadales bacterium]|nr:MAG: virulence protein SciE type [Gemmatimonadales bacterium]
MKARAQLEKGDLSGAIETLSRELRDNPTSTRHRTFLFELLCFAGQYDRARKQLDVLSRGGQEAEMGALLYRAALHAEEERDRMFSDEDFSRGESGAPDPVSGILNGERFESLEDVDPRIGARLEVYAGGQYTWLPLEHVASVTMEPPKRLRDLLWAPAHVMPGAGMEKLELGEVLLPVLSPLSSRANEDALRLGRATDWAETSDGLPYPVGQKLFLVDGEAVPILEIRELVVDPPADSGGES